MMNIIVLYKPAIAHSTAALQCLQLLSPEEDIDFPVGGEEVSQCKMGDSRFPNREFPSLQPIDKPPIRHGGGSFN